MTPVAVWMGRTHTLRLPEGVEAAPIEVLGDPPPPRLLVPGEAWETYTRTLAEGAPEPGAVILVLAPGQSEPLDAGDLADDVVEDEPGLIAAALEETAAAAFARLDAYTNEELTALLHDGTTPPPEAAAARAELDLRLAARLSLRFRPLTASVDPTRAEASRVAAAVLIALLAAGLRQRRAGSLRSGEEPTHTPPPDPDFLAEALEDGVVLPAAAGPADLTFELDADAGTLIVQSSLPLTAEIAAEGRVTWTAVGDRLAVPLQPLAAGGSFTLRRSEPEGSDV